MKKVLLLLAVTVSLISNAQFGSGIYVAGDGLTTYATLYDHNTFAAQAPCGTVTRFTRYNAGTVTSLPNNASCNWQFQDGAGGVGALSLNYNDWATAPGTSYDLTAANIKLTVNAVNSTYIELLIEKLDPALTSSTFGIDYYYTGHSASLNPCEIDCEDPVIIDPIICDVSVTTTSCEGLNCLKVTKVNLDTACPNCYCVQVMFTDGTQASFDASFAQGNTVMHCFVKDISSYNLIAKDQSECDDCMGRMFRDQSGNTDTVDTYQDRLSLFPNPSSTGFKLDGIEVEKVKEVTVFDLQGKKVKQLLPAAQYNVEDLPKGVYIVKILDVSNQQHELKLIKE